MPGQSVKGEASVVRLSAWVNRFASVSSTDPDSARRSKLLTVLLGGVGLLDLIALAMIVVVSILAPNEVGPKASAAAGDANHQVLEEESPPCGRARQKLGKQPNQHVGFPSGVLRGHLPRI